MSSSATEPACTGSARAKYTRGRIRATSLARSRSRRTSTSQKPESDAQPAFVHRKLADGDLYFLDNRNDRDETVDANFRIAGRAPELWHAETGKTEPASYRIADGRTHRAAASGAVGHRLRRLPPGPPEKLAEPCPRRLRRCWPP